MGQATAETVKEIEEARERIATNLEHLEERLPKPALLAKRAAGVALGGGVMGSATLFALRRARKRRARKRQPAAMQAVVQVVPDRFVRSMEHAVARMHPEDMKRWGASFAGLMILMKLAELRRLRSLTEALLRSRTVG